MALIKCPGCGQLVSDKAKSCPRCGFLIADEPEFNHSQDDDYDTPERGSVMKWVLISAAAVAVIAALCVYIYIDAKSDTQPHHNEDEISETTDETSQVDAAELEATRQDSIKWVNFTTPDLALFELHGHVKSVSGYQPLASDVFGEYNYENPLFSFDYDGNTKKRQRDDYFLGFKADSKGRITSGVFAESGGYPTLELKWNDNDKLTSCSSSYGSNNGIAKYTYDKNGDLIKAHFEEHANQGYEHIEDVTYKILERDKFGNWTKRQMSTKITKGHDDIETCQHVEEHNSQTKIETRTITYHDRQ